MPTYRWTCRPWSSNATATAATRARWTTRPIPTRRCWARTRSGPRNGCTRRDCGREKARRVARASRSRAERLPLVQSNVRRRLDLLDLALGQELLVLVPRHRRKAGVDFLHGDAAGHGADQATQVAADAGVLLD